MRAAGEEAGSVTKGRGGSGKAWNSGVLVAEPAARLDGCAQGVGDQLQKERPERPKACRVEGHAAVLRQRGGRAKGTIVDQDRGEDLLRRVVEHVVDLVVPRDAPVR